MAKQVLRYTDYETRAVAEIEGVGGKVIQVFSPKAFVAEIPNEVDPQILEASSSKPVEPLDDVTQEAVDKWIAAQKVEASARGLVWCRVCGSVHERPECMPN